MDIYALASYIRFVYCIIVKIMLQIIRPHTRFEGTHERSSVNIKHGNRIIRPRCPGPDAFFSIGQNVAELAIPMARPFERFRVLAHLRVGYARALLAAVGAEGIPAVLAKESHGVAHKFVGGVVVEG